MWISHRNPHSLSLLIHRFSHNRADDGDGGGLAGAISLSGSNFSNKPTFLDNVTIANNNYAGFMGGAFLWGGGDFVTLKDSIMSSLVIKHS